MVCYSDVPSANALVDELLKDKESLLVELRENMELAQTRMQKSANQRRREVEYEVGDWVYLKLRPYRQSTVARRRNEKLAQRYFGPYKVIERKGKVAYKLKLPEHSQIHPVIHVSQLKRAIPANHKPQEIPACMTNTYEWAPEPEGITDVRRSPQGSDTELLVKWKGLPEFESTWESVVTMMKQFHDFNLEDKVSSLPGGIDRLRVPMMFMRKKTRSKGRKAIAWRKNSMTESG